MNAVKQRRSLLVQARDRRSTHPFIGDRPSKLRPTGEKHLELTPLCRLSEDDVPHLGSATLQTITWSIVSGFERLANDAGISRARTPPSPTRYFIFR